MTPRIFMHVPHDEPDDGEERIPLWQTAAIVLVMSTALWALIFVVGMLLLGAIL